MDRFTTVPIPSGTSTERYYSRKEKEGKSSHVWRVHDLEISMLPVSAHTFS